MRHIGFGSRRLVVQKAEHGQYEGGTRRLEVLDPKSSTLPFLVVGFCQRRTSVRHKNLAAELHEARLKII